MWKLHALALVAFTSVLPAQDLVVPVLNDRFPNLLRDATAASFSVDLGARFSTEEILPEMVRLAGEYVDSDGDEQVANLDFLLFQDRTPLSRDNFLGYVDRGDYVDTIIHRAITGFVIQGGGFRIADNGDETIVPAEIVPVETQLAIENEPGVSNTLGTISFARLEGEPDSATSQWFVSIGQNQEGLDDQNGGFTVFGRITQSTFANAQLVQPGADSVFDTSPGLFGARPVRTGAASPFVRGDFFSFTSATRIPVPSTEAATNSTLRYEAELLTAGVPLNFVIDGETLRMERTSLVAPGTVATVRVSAIDSIGNRVSDDFQIFFSFDYSYWRAFHFSLAEVSDDSVSGPSADPNRTGVTNIERFARNLSPSDSAEPLRVTPLINNNSTLLALDYPLDGLVFGLNQVVEGSEDLDVWESVPILESGRIGSLRRQIVAIDPEAQRKLFFRLSLSTEE